MRDKLEFYRKYPQHFHVEISDYKCPICNSNLYLVSSRCMFVFDGNSIFHCDNNDGHVFWKNARDMKDVLRLNPNASETNFEYDKEYILENNKWNEVND